jgi:mono/diheme cytochrome c family protein
MATGCSTAPDTPYAGDPREGYAVAQSLCASCHAIEALGASPNAGAPPLRYVLANYAPDNLVRDLEHAVSINHLRMPTFYFGERHPADLVAYLKQIQQPPPPANQ